MFQKFKSILKIFIIFFLLFAFIGAATAFNERNVNTVSENYGELSDLTQIKSVSTSHSSNSEVRNITLTMESPSTVAFLIIAGLIALIIAYFILSKT